MLDVIQRMEVRKVVLLPCIVAALSRIGPIAGQVLAVGIHSHASAFVSHVMSGATTMRTSGKHIWLRVQIWFT